MGQERISFQQIKDTLNTSSVPRLISQQRKWAPHFQHLLKTLTSIRGSLIMPTTTVLYSPTLKTTHTTSMSRGTGALLVWRLQRNYMTRENISMTLTNVKLTLTS